jgi:uncharacterized membrane protein YgcG
MSRLHSTFVAFVLGAAAATGLFAMSRTLRLGQTAAATPPALIARELAVRRAKLAHWSHNLQEARAKHPPALPKIPVFAPIHIPSAPAAPPAAPAAAATPQVTYVRPKAVVTYRHASAPHTSTGSSKPSSSDDGGSDDGGGDDSGGGD